MGGRMMGKVVDTKGAAGRGTGIKFVRKENILKEIHKTGKGCVGLFAEYSSGGSSFGGSCLGEMGNSARTRESVIQRADKKKDPDRTVCTPVRDEYAQIHHSEMWKSRIITPVTVSNEWTEEKAIAEEENKKRIKLAIKHWEKDFKKKNGRRPLESEIMTDPDILKWYKKYKLAKAKCVEAYKENTGEGNGNHGEDESLDNVENSQEMQTGMSNEAELRPSKRRLTCKAIKPKDLRSRPLSLFCVLNRPLLGKMVVRTPPMVPGETSAPQSPPQVHRRAPANNARTEEGALRPIVSRRRLRFKRR
eukprot:Nk52_evm5s2514 gene=Nk52_evmTU5s2514